MKYCMRCGYENQDTARFCQNCGAPLSAAEPPAGAAPDSEKTALPATPAPEVSGQNNETAQLSQPVDNTAGQGDETVLLNAPAPEPADEDQTVLLNHTAAQGAANNMMGAASPETEPAAALQEDDATVLLASSPLAEPAEGGDETVLLGGPSGEAAYTPPPQQEIPAAVPSSDRTPTEYLFAGEPTPAAGQSEYIPPVQQGGPVPAGNAAPPFIPPQNPAVQKAGELGKKKRRGLWITLICVLAVVVLGAVTAGYFWLQGGNTASPLQEALQLGEKYLEEMDYENAVVAFTEATAIDPSSKEAYLGLAQAHTGAREYDEAEAAYRQLLELDASNAEGYRELAELYIRLEKLEEAKQLLEAAVNATDDENIQNLYNETMPKAPTFSLQEGSYSQRQEVAIATEKDTQVVYYTTDGTEPTQDSQVYQEPIILKNGRTTLKAIAVSSRGYQSETASAAYRIDVERTEIVFEDRMIESAVREALGVGYGTLYNEDVEQVTELNIVGYSVYRPGMSALFTEDSYSVQTGGWGYNSSSLGRLETLDDLKYMPFLRRLHIAFQEEVDITGVAAAKRLEELSLIHVGVQDLEPVAGLTNLQKLCVGWNEISDISPVANLSALTSLGIWNNRVTDISAVQNLKALTYLDFSGNRVQDISAVAGLNSLSSLWMYSNRVSDFTSLEGLTELKVLMIRDNPIADKASLQKVFPRLGRTDVDVIDRGGDAQ